VRVFVALPIVDDDDALLGTVIISRTPREELQALYNMAGPTQVIGGLVAVLLTLAGSVFASVVLTRNLRRLDQGARQIAGGSFAGIDELQVPTTSHVAEVARLAGSVASMAVRLQARIGYIGEFASNVSHEFKTPLATLKGTVELLEDDPEMPPEQRQRFFDNANRELARLEALVQGLLSLARADAEPVRAAVDLDALVQSVADRRPVLVEGPFGVASGDVTQLELVLVNLVDNALQHGRGDDGERQVTVTIRGRAEGSGFVVHDDGAGISAGNVDKVFDRFFTTDRARGTGLGLALVRAIVERHGGSLTVRSAPGDTAFTVSLPSPAAIAPAT
jgi:signal transduction histidine kinase